MPAFQFDSSAHRPEYGEGGMLPVGKHPVMIVETELKPTKSGDGGYLALTMEAIDGPAKGGKQTDRLNLHNANAMTVEIANKQLSAYCYVTGVFKFTDTNELCRRPFVVEIAPQKNKPEMTEVVAVYTSDMRKPAEVLASGNAPANNGAKPVIPPTSDQGSTQGNFGTQSDTGQTAQTNASPSNGFPVDKAGSGAWGGGGTDAPAAQPSGAAQAWGSGNATGPAPWANPGS